MNYQSFNRAYFALLCVVTLVVGWVIPSEFVDRFETDLVLLVVLLITAYALQLSEAQNAGWIEWGVVLIIGIIFTVAAIRLEPIWTAVALLLLEGRFAEAGVQLSSHPHANPFLFAGLGTIFISLVGAIRVGLFKLLERRNFRSL